MANFWDLPETVRQKIYRLHLVQEQCIKVGRDYRMGLVPFHTWRRTLRLPALFTISARAETEAAGIYYGENHFDVGVVLNVLDLGGIVPRRHLPLVKRITCNWDGPLPGEGFRYIAGRLKGLEELNIRVDEALMVRCQMSRHNRPRAVFIDKPTPQQQLSIVRSSGYADLLKISGVQHVRFIGMGPGWPTSIVKSNGPIPGGFLETHVLPKLKGVARGYVKIGLQDETFPFLSLPPEVRNRIYNLLLCIQSKVHPSTADPSSKQKKTRSRRISMPVPESALSIVATNKQINKEAFGIFYNCNEFEFYYPTQLSAFILSLSSDRLSCVRDITVHYYTYSLGGINLAEITFPLLKQLSGLRKLHVLVDTRLSVLAPHCRWSDPAKSDIQTAKPLWLPGISMLFALRGLTHIKVRYPAVEKELDEMKSNKRYPTFPDKSMEHYIMMVARALDYFNGMLAKAQTGDVDKIQSSELKSFEYVRTFFLTGDAFFDDT